ncbi:MAG: hypothetical protein K0U93_02865 [Gammaproteobacteria bacterium]|nr:hypothetical protein [Gammaproteobacteria bacterium]
MINRWIRGIAAALMLTCISLAQADGGGIELHVELRSYYLDDAEDPPAGLLIQFSPQSNRFGFLSFARGRTDEAKRESAGGGLFGLFSKQKEVAPTAVEYELGGVYRVNDRIVIAPTAQQRVPMEVIKKFEASFTRGVSVWESYEDGDGISITLPDGAYSVPEATDSAALRYVSDLPKLGQLFGKGYLAQDERFGLHVLIRPNVVRNAD